MPDPVLQVTDLRKEYGSFLAVDNISFEVPRGKVVGLLGPNGAGKTTTIQMLVGITEMTAGDIRYFGEDFRRTRRKSLQRINFTSTYSSLQDLITVRQNLTVFGTLYSVRDLGSKIDELSEYFGITHLLGQFFAKLSTGEKTRVNLVKSLINDPELVLMDEPTASLDPDVRDRTLSLIEEARANRGLSILYTSHNMEEVTRICDEVIFLHHGKIVEHDTPKNLVRQVHGARLELDIPVGKDRAVAILRKDGLEVRVGESIEVITDDSAIPGLLARLDTSDIVVREIEVRRRTLDDVFLDVARKQSDNVED